ncbi:IS3 family transposase [Tetragenococcus koreensis]|uniref:IS3 family transposase n=1 Tax=Tetragenococcus koreensis TaxID=290335 RepID=UPI002E19E806
MRYLNEEKNYAIQPLCDLLQVTRSAYYHWRDNPLSDRELENQRLASWIRQIHQAHPDMGYRRIRDELYGRYDLPVSDKRVLRICRYEGIQSTIKSPANSLTVPAKHPYHTADNILDRNFHAEAPNEKWCTDISEFRYGNGDQKHRIYLSAIIDLYDRRIVAYKISDQMALSLVTETLDQAVTAVPNAHPIFHSDRGKQYTSKQFHSKLRDLGMTQSMSRVGKCIDNGPMEGFWGMLKREKYYRRHFQKCQELTDMIAEYIDYYNHRRFQRRLNVLTPMAYHERFYQAA